MTKDEAKISERRNLITRARTAEYLAREILRRQGYAVLRPCEIDTPINLIAWIPDGDSFFIRVTTTRKALAGAAEVALLWGEEIALLRLLSVPANGSVHLWIYTDRKAWHRYQVLAGGLLETAL